MEPTLQDHQGLLAAFTQPTDFPADACVSVAPVGLRLSQRKDLEYHGTRYSSTLINMTGKTKDIPRLTHCPQCGYDLAGLPVKHACPECGYAYDKGDIVVRGWKKGKTPSLLRILAWGALMVLIIAPWRSTSPAPVLPSLWQPETVVRHVAATRLLGSQRKLVLIADR